MSIELHIERLVLDETLLGGERAALLGDAISRELARRLAHPAAPHALLDLGHSASLRAIAAPPLRPGDHLGARVARAVQQSLGLPGPADAGGRR